MILTGLGVFRLLSVLRYRLQCCNRHKVFNTLHYSVLQHVSSSTASLLVSSQAPYLQGFIACPCSHAAAAAAAHNVIDAASVAWPMLAPSFSARSFRLLSGVLRSVRLRSSSTAHCEGRPLPPTTIAVQASPPDRLIEYSTASAKQCHC
jgi:hypothetical protein